MHRDRDIQRRYRTGYPGIHNNVFNQQTYHHNTSQIKHGKINNLTFSKEQVRQRRGRRRTPGDSRQDKTTLFVNLHKLQDHDAH